MSADDEVIDLRRYEFMPLSVQALRDSEIADRHKVSAEGFRAAVLLWCASWHQVPAATLPDDDRALARMAGLDGDLRRWRHIREEALHGFVFNESIGRLQHIWLGCRAKDVWEKGRKKRESLATARRNKLLKNNKNDLSSHTSSQDSSQDSSQLLKEKEKENPLISQENDDEGEGERTEKLAPDGQHFSRPGCRADGTNPRSTGSSLRDRGINPRAIAKAAAAEACAPPPMPDPDGTPIGDAWAGAVMAVDAVHEKSWSLWLSRVDPIELNGSLTLRAPTAFVADWIKSRYGATIEATVGVPLKVVVGHE